MRLSVILITKNESAHIAQCLRSVSFADEIIVVDSGSTDDTVALARAAEAQVHETADWPGFGPQKNRALDKATGDWILSIDADERVPPELRDEILGVIAGNPSASNSYDGYEIPRRSWYCGRFIKHAGWSSDFVLRLFRREAARFSDQLVHERVVMCQEAGQSGQKALVGRLSNVMLHYTYQDFSQVLKKVDSYSTLSAQQMYAKGKRASVWSAFLHGLWAFIRTYFLRLGILDGGQGFALAVSSAEHSYYRYIKLWLLEQEQRGTSS